MHFLLHATTDAATYALFDPGAVPAEAVSLKRPMNSLQALADSGHALALMDDSDGDHTLLLLINQPTDPRLARHGKKALENSYLDVPSGRIVFAGWEQVCAFKPAYNPTDFVPPKERDKPVECQIPRGHYSLDVYELDWEDEIDKEVSRRAEPGDEKYNSKVGTTMGCMVVANILLFPALLIMLWVNVSFGAALKALAVIIGIQLIFWPIMRQLCKSPRWTRYQKLRDEVEQEFPSLVVNLTTLEAKPSSFAPAKVSLGEFEPEEARGSRSQPPGSK